MKLSEYFQNTRGRGVLATADSNGVVDVAVYARPHFMDENTIAFIMLERLSHENLKTNPHAAYLFMESGEKFAGKRLYLTKIKEETDPEAIEKIRRRKSYNRTEEDKDKKRYLVYFRIDKVLPLKGDKE
ncbi:MAG TPA: pyridoxamine 5'-phosphate oxidase family protein [Syntrophorhabdaceae bacterium]|nr:pyridoxamine 5'-phosphate oxidase family protein [Syntrophorhabdaceae bacterium]